MADLTDAQIDAVLDRLAGIGRAWQGRYMVLRYLTGAPPPRERQIEALRAALGPLLEEVVRKAREIPPSRGRSMADRLAPDGKPGLLDLGEG